MKFLKNLGLVLLLALVLAAWVMLPWFGALALAVLLALWMLLTRRGAQAHRPVPGRAPRPGRPGRTPGPR